MPQGPFPSAKASFYSLQLQLQPCFSLVVQMRPWWSPVSLLPASDTHHPPPHLNLTSAPCHPHQLPSPYVLPTMATNHL